MEHKDVKSVDEIPARTYRITYRGAELFSESEMRGALARLPKDEDVRGWKILLEKEGVGGQSVVYDGSAVWKDRRAAA